MAEQLIINGVNIYQAYDQLFDTRDKIRQEASKVMSDNIELAQSITKQLATCADIEKIQQYAAQAYNALVNVKVVSEVSGVEYSLPYSSHDSLLSSYNNNLFKNVEIIENLKELFDELETQTSKWNASYC